MTDTTEPETTEASYDQAAARWERNAPVLLSDFTARPFLLEWCEPEYARVLDLGCGEGYVARQLGERGARSVHGIDVSAEMVERAKSLHAAHSHRDASGKPRGILHGMLSPRNIS